MRVAVTGASGFIGSALCRDLREQGHEVFAAVRQGVALDAARVSVVGEIGPKVDWRPTLRGCDAVVHLAGRAHVASRADESALVPYRRVNRDGSVALAEQAAELGVRRFVFVSTILVNGPDSSRPFLASDAPAPRDPYAISKLEAELALSEVAARTGMELVIVRPPLVYGPDVRANFLRLLKLAASGIPLPLAGVPGVRSFISRWNLNDLLILCLRHPAAAGRVILASDGEDISLPDLIRHLAHAMGRPCRLFSAPPGVLRTIAGSLGARSVVDKLLASLRVDISETRNLLGWNPPVPLLEGLTRTAVWYSRSRAGALAQPQGEDTARTGQSSAVRQPARPPQKA